jgi:hypothetical protein
VGDGDLAARLAAVEARLAALEERIDGDGETSVTALALQSIWAHLDEAGLDGFPERIVNDLIDLTGHKPPSLDGDLEDLEGRLQKIEAKVGSISEGSESDTADVRGSGPYDKRFLALARQVKALKNTVGALEQEAADVRQDATVEVLKVLRSEEFKELFNTKMQGVLQHLKGEIVPNAVERVLRAMEEEA